MCVCNKAECISPAMKPQQLERTEEREGSGGGGGGGVKCYKYNARVNTSGCVSSCLFRCVCL